MRLMRFVLSPSGRALLLAWVVFAPVAASANTAAAISAISAAATLEEAQAALQSGLQSLRAEHPDVSSEVVEQAQRDMDSTIRTANENRPAPVVPVTEEERQQAQELREAADAARENEHSLENRMLGGLTMAATGIGGMQLAQGLAEMRADRAAASDIANFMRSIRCGIGGARNVPYGEISQTPEESREFHRARMDYIRNADRLRNAREALGLPPGIEAELVIDTSVLYTGRGTDTDGFRNQFDTAQERYDSNAGRNRAIAGGAIAGAGILGGMIGNAAINQAGPFGGIAERISERRGRGEEGAEEFEQLLANSNSLDEAIQNFDALPPDQRRQVMTFARNNHNDVLDGGLCRARDDSGLLRAGNPGCAPRDTAPARGTATRGSGGGSGLDVSNIAGSIAPLAGGAGGEGGGMPAGVGQLLQRGG